MSVASEDKTTVARRCIQRCPPRGQAITLQRTQLGGSFAHTWVLDRAITSSVEPRSYDRARVADHARCIPGHSEHRSGGRNFAGHRAQRALWQRPAGRDGRSDVRVDGRRHQSHARTRRRLAFPIVGAARAPCIGPAVPAGGRCRSESWSPPRSSCAPDSYSVSGSGRGSCASVAWLFVPTVFGVAFTMAVITLALYAANTIVVEATELVWGLLMFFSTGFVPLPPVPRLDSAGRPTSADELRRRGDARIVTWRSGARADGRNAALVGWHRRCVRGTDGDRVSKGQHAGMKCFIAVFPTARELETCSHRR